MVAATASPFNFRLTAGNGVPVLLGGTSHLTKYPPLSARPPLLTLSAYKARWSYLSATTIFSEEQKAASWFRRPLSTFSRSFAAFT